MSTLPLSMVKARFSEVVRQVRAGGEPVIVTVDGSPAVEIRAAAAFESPGPHLGQVPAFWALLGLIQAQMEDAGEPFDAVELVAEGRR